MAVCVPPLCYSRNSGRFSVELAAQKERAEHVREIVSYLVIYHKLLSAFLGVKASGMSGP
jgi:hypothetical protein